MGTAIGVVLARAGLEVQLGCRTAAQAERLEAERENAEYLPGVRLDKGIRCRTVTEIEFAGVDLVVMAVPCSGLPAAVGEIGARVGERSAVLVASKGLVPPLGSTPTAYVSERVRARAVAGRVFSEVHELALASGGRSETFAGLAGAGDLVATTIAEGGNRRAGEMVGAGVPAGQVEATVQQTAESLATVPLLTEAFVTAGLRRVLDGETSPDQWLESIRSAKPEGRTRAA